MVHWFNALLKDKEIIAAEVMREYNKAVRSFLLALVRILSPDAGITYSAVCLPSCQPHP
jgi:hypothetical protein